MTIFFSLNPSQFFEQILFPPANQPDTKVCMHAYLFPFPISHPINNSTEYESAISEWFTTVFLLTSYHKVILYSFSGFSTHSLTHTHAVTNMCDVQFIEASGASSCWSALCLWYWGDSSSFALLRLPAIICTKPEAYSSWRQVGHSEPSHPCSFIFEWECFSSSHTSWSSSLLCSRYFPAGGGGHVCSVDSGVGRGGALHGLP